MSQLNSAWTDWRDKQRAKLSKSFAKKSREEAARAAKKKLMSQGYTEYDAEIAAQNLVAEKNSPPIQQYQYPASRRSILVDGDITPFVVAGLALVVLLYVKRRK
jgi:hypothetical protein